MNRITSLFGIRYPIIQGGMVWCSGWRLASAVSNAGGLGLLYSYFRVYFVRGGLIWHLALKDIFIAVIV